MSREVFLADLEHQLRHLDKAECQDVLEFYKEYFDEAGPENEQKVLEELGDPKEIAKNLNIQSAFNQAEANPKSAKKGLRAVWIGIGAFFAAPVALPLALAAAIVALALVIVLIALLITFFAVVLCLGVGAVAAVVMAAIALFASPSAALMTFGMALTMAGLAGLIFVPTLIFSRWCFRSMASGINRLVRRK